MTKKEFISALNKLVNGDNYEPSASSAFGSKSYGEREAMDLEEEYGGRWDETAASTRYDQIKAKFDSESLQRP